MVFHGFLEIVRGDFQRGVNQRSSGFYRFINEIPTVLLIWIVVMVVVKPFS
jgi:putative membrane protein